MSTVLLAAAAVLAAAVVVLLALPLEVRFRVQGVSPVRGHIALRGVFGLCRMRLAVPPPAPARARGQAASCDSTQAPSRRHVPAGSGPVRLLWRDPALRRNAMAHLREALGSLRWSDLRLRVQLGLDDPADTGRLWALLGPLGAMLASLQTADVAIAPDFVEARLDIDAQGRVVLVPMRLLWPLGLLAGHFGLALARRRLAGGELA